MLGRDDVQNGLERNPNVKTYSDYLSPKVPTESLLKTCNLKPTPQEYLVSKYARCEH